MSSSVINQHSNFFLYPFLAFEVHLDPWIVWEKWHLVTIIYHSIFWPQFIFVWIGCSGLLTKRHTSWWNESQKRLSAMQAFFVQNIMLVVVSYSDFRSIVDVVICQISEVVIWICMRHWTYIHSLDFLLPSTVFFSNDAARVTSGWSWIYRPVSSQLNTWLRNRFFPLINSEKEATKLSAASLFTGSFSSCTDELQIPSLTTFLYVELSSLIIQNFAQFYCFLT